MTTSGAPRAARTKSDHLVPGPVCDEIARAIDHIYSGFVGRGPRETKVHPIDNLLVVVCDDIYTTAEQSLIAIDHESTVLELRQGFQQAMREAIVSAVETRTGRRVDAFMSANHIEPDMAVEIVVLA